MSMHELILQYIKTFIWPFIVIVVLFFFYAETKNILSGDVEAEMFGIKIKGSGQEILELKKTERTLKENIKKIERDLDEQNKLNDRIVAVNIKLRDALENQNKEIELAKNEANYELLQASEIPQEPSESIKKSKENRDSIVEALQTINKVLKISAQLIP